MSHDQCPSTKGKRSPDQAKRKLPTSNGRPVWRSPEEYADSAEFRELLEREFPPGASELAKESRRDFMKFMGAGLALAGAATIPGCRRPDHKIYSYSREVPERVVPGKPLWYTTSMPLPGGGAEGLMVETHEGRPTKIEGNPLHPINQGKTSAWSQASTLELYDPERPRRPVFGNPARGKLNATIDDFKAWATDHLAGHDEDGGERLAFIVAKKTSPTRNSVRDRLRERFPRAFWLAYEPTQNDAAIEGSTLAFGRPMRELPRPERANVVVTFDRGLLEREAMSLPASRGVARMRYVDGPNQPMSRVYAIESDFTAMGSMADHRLRLAPSQVGNAAIAIGRELLGRMQSGTTRQLREALANLGDGRGEGVGREFVAAVVDDLLADGNRGRSLLLAGASQSASIHALVHAMNAALGNIGQTVSFLPMSDEEAASSVQGLRTLASRMERGQIETLVTVDVNPVYDAPADLNFAELYARVPHTIAYSLSLTETYDAANRWQLNGTSYLESWGDTEAADGTIAPIQPMIAPLYAPAMSELELLAFFAGDSDPDGHRIVREHWQRGMRLTGERFDQAWARALHDGVLAGSTPRPETPSVDYGAVARAMVTAGVAPAPTSASLEVVFTTGHVHDGRYANNGWLQELPHGGTRVVWDNPVLVSPRTARDLRLEPLGGAEDPYTRRQIPQARMARLAVGGRTVEVPVWVMPGLADNVVQVMLGYGRTVGGTVAKGVGINTYGVRTSDRPAVARGGTLTRVRGSYEIASTQNHWSLEGRDAVVRQIDKPAWDKHSAKPVVPKPDKIYGDIDAWGDDPQRLNVAEKMGELSHTPSNISIYVNPMNRSRTEPDPDAIGYNRALRRDMPPAFAMGPQWGMTIDMATCTGCGVCTVACSAENNIPVVGKREVAKGRAMTWIRVDRYFTGDDLNSPDQMLHQPIACVHCENAPCEVVCPVNATVHGPEGTNDMVYNRCIGTRYCSNNCPYKVRRFNFFDYSQAKFNGGWVAEEETGLRPRNINFVPPRLREQVNEISKMRMNPDVTVRSRGVMEKCTYCIQRVNRARFEMKLKGADTIPDGFVQTACQQACPTGAITFGDILDQASKVSKERETQRSYLLLGYLNVRPRTSHLIRVNNPNPRLREPVDPLDYGHADASGSTFVEPRKRDEDQGYAMSLRILGTGAPA